MPVPEVRPIAWEAVLSGRHAPSVLPRDCPSSAPDLGVALPGRDLAALAPRLRVAPAALRPDQALPRAPQGGCRATLQRPDLPSGWRQVVQAVSLPAQAHLVRLPPGQQAHHVCAYHATSPQVCRRQWPQAPAGLPFRLQRLLSPAGPAQLEAAQARWVKEHPAPVVDHLSLQLAALRPWVGRSAVPPSQFGSAHPQLVLSAPAQPPAQCHPGPARYRRAGAVLAARTRW